MTIRHLLLGALLAACGLASAQTLRDKLPESIRKEGVLRFVGDSHPPYRITTDGKTFTGIDTDFARALEPLLGVKIEQHLASGLPAMLAGVEAGRYHLTMGPIKDTKERETRFDFVVWTHTRPSFLYTLDGGKKIESNEQLCGIKIALVAGTVIEDAVKRLGERCVAAGGKTPEVLTFTDHNASILAVQSRRADTAGLTMTAALFAIKANPEKFAVYADTKATQGVDQLGLVVSKASGLAPVMLEAMQALFKSGEYDRIMAKWGISAVRMDAPRMNVGQ
jgi:polar amino acid transport system substrate-binding protein